MPKQDRRAAAYNMEKYDYMEAVKEDVKAWLEDHEDFKESYADEAGAWLRDDNADEIADELNERLFCEDSVTGNGSGSYYCNTWRAEESLCHNLDLLGEALTEFGCDANYITENGAEACDVTIRCYLLGSAIREALEELQEQEDEE